MRFAICCILCLTLGFSAARASAVAPGSLVTITPNTAGNTIGSYHKLVIMFFCDDTDTSCLKEEPIVRAVAAKFALAPEVIFVKVDITKSPHLATIFHVSSPLTFIEWDNFQPTGQYYTAAIPGVQLEQRVNNALSLYRKNLAMRNVESVDLERTLPREIDLSVGQKLLLLDNSVSVLTHFDVKATNSDLVAQAVIEPIKDPKAAFFNQSAIAAFVATRAGTATIEIHRTISLGPTASRTEKVKVVVR